MNRIKAALERHEFVRHVLTLMSGTAVAQILPILVMAVIGHYFTDVQLGVFAAVLAVVNFLVPIAAGRYDVAIVLPTNDDDARQLVRLATIINTAVCLAATVLLFFLAGPISRIFRYPDAVGWIYGAAGIAWLYAEVILLSYWLTRKKNYKLIASNKIHQSVSTSAIQAGAGVLSLGVSGLVVATLVGQAAALVNLVRKAGRDIWARPTTGCSMRELAAEYKKMPLLNGPNALADSVRLNGITFMITSLFSNAATGQFSMAWRVLQMPLALINGALSQVFFQRLTQVDRGDMVRTVKKAIVRSAAIGVVPFALLYVLCPPLLPIFLDVHDHAKWQIAGQIGAVLVPWLYLNLITSPLATVFIVMRRQGVLLVFSLFYMAVPLGIIWATRPLAGGVSGPAIVHTITCVSWAMTGLLVVFLLLAVWCAHAWDTGDTPPGVIGERD